MVHFYVLTILKHVLRIALQSVDIDILREHERISTTMQSHILDLKAVDFPEGLVGIRDLYILQFQIPHLAEELRTIDARVPHHHIIGIPDSRTGPESEIAVLYISTINMPPRVFAIKLTPVRLDITALLDTTLTVLDSDILNSQIVLCE